MMVDAENQMGTPRDRLSLIAPGAQVVVRDEEWIVRSARETVRNGLEVRALGTSELVRDREATFFTELDDVQVLRPEETRLVPDDSPHFRTSRLFLEALLRRTPLPMSETRLAMSPDMLLDDLEYQRRPVAKALESLRPRLLIGDAVGLGKTLEIGMILAELIRRGRGERILVVTPRHILDQFQREMWTRFAIPLVRLDTDGIQRVRQKIPATRNPFTYYKRAIVSVDTLKNAGRYRHHLENVHWDAVVMDECHNLMNSNTLNNELAKVLAPRTEALILASATPHNGRRESLARLIDLLDPTAVADPADYDHDDIAHLFVRRHKNSEDVSAQVGTHWADRKQPIPVSVPAGPAEEAVFAELVDTWLYPSSGKAPTSGKGSTLFPWILFKAFLSSHVALHQTVEERRKRIASDVVDAAENAGPAERTAKQTEDAALARLTELCEGVTRRGSAKLDALVEELRQIGVGPGSPMRAAVFSERVGTLEWLHAELPARLGLPEEAVRIMHGGLADRAQMDLVEEFARADSPVRVLLTGDVASEGVNLHQQCHHLFHYDLPWSLITIEQRNGRIDRYGQERSPEIRALLLTSANERIAGDVRVLTRLLAKEDEAHRAFGDAASIMGLHSEKREEDEVLRALASDSSLDEVAPDADAPLDALSLALGYAQQDTRHEPVRTAPRSGLFDSDEAFLLEALREAYDEPERRLHLHREPENGLLAFDQPDDLQRRLDALPQSYLTAHNVKERVRLTTKPWYAEQRLDRAKQGGETLWPDVVYLNPQHPVLDWAVDKVLVQLGRNEAPVIVADVDEPTFLLQGIWSNRRGQATVVQWMAVSGLDQLGDVEPMENVLHRAGVDSDMHNPGARGDFDRLYELLPEAVRKGQGYMQARQHEQTAELQQRVKEYHSRLRTWTERAEQLVLDLGQEHRRRKEQQRIDEVGDSMTKLIESLKPEGEPLIRVVGVLVKGR